MNHINVLVISANAFSDVLNNGKTYKAIFSAFNKKQLHQLYFRPQESKFIDSEFCTDYYSVSEISIFRDLFHVSASTKKKETEYTTSHDNDAHLYNTFLKKIISPNGILRDMVWKTNLWKNHKFKKWCRETNADVIFFVAGGSGYSHNIARFVSEYLKAPLVVYFTDDYLLYPLTENLSSKIHKIRMKRFYRKTIDKSSLFFGIGDLMAEEYSAYFGKEFYSIMNSTDVVPYCRPKSAGPVIISYFGGLHTKRWEMIAGLAKIIGEKATIKVYSFDHLSEKIRSAFNKSGVLFIGGLTGVEYRNAIIESNILLHVESDDKYYRSLTHLSVSTKLPEYLMSGRLVLGFGPVDLASMRILTDNEIGAVISSEDNNSNILKKIERVIENREYQIEMGLKAYEYAKNHFDNDRISRDFKEKIFSLVSKQ